MSRIKLVVIAAALLVIIVGAIPAVAAANPNPVDCQYDCYASNYGSTSGDGTKTAGQLWYYNSTADPDAVSLRTVMRNAVITQHPKGGTLTVYKCTDGQRTTCPGVQYVYTANGTETATQLGSQYVPTTGVPVPVVYLLLGGLVLAALLLAAGFALRFRARRMTA